MNGGTVLCLFFRGAEKFALAICLYSFFVNDRFIFHMIFQETFIVNSNSKRMIRVMYIRLVSTSTVQLLERELCVSTAVQYSE